uniref:Thylakoid membrane protein n=1 Tax=Corethron hystrix TaxID=216773 RepID=A0A7S1BN70_9STRA|mmetsp:Transcript_35009/g.80940  ORF Transcript_35009/g.80940 Transcript_35009/m.80940 type:complete len:246 (+) Transcript_35009:170-907(+)
MREISSVLLAAIVFASVGAFNVPHQQLSFVRRQMSSATQLPRTTSTPALFMSDDDNGWAAPKSAMIGGAGVNNAGEPPFEIRGFSLGNLVIGLGVLITVASFAEYLGDSAGEGLNVSGLGFVYGIPVFLAGAALKYAEIEPVPCFINKGGDATYESKATETIKKIRQDVTRHRYGDEAHLDTTVKKLGLVVPGKDYPQLQELRVDTTAQGELSFTMVWQSVDTPYKMWADENRVKRYETFFWSKC